MSFNTLWLMIAIIATYLLVRRIASNGRIAPRISGGVGYKTCRQKVAIFFQRLRLRDSDSAFQ